MLMMRRIKSEGGSTLVELVIGIFILGMIGLSFFGLYNALITSSLAAKQKAAALTLATNQMEYLKSLPYNSLAVAGGSIYAQNPLPASFSEKVNNHQYTVRTSINYVDDAFDGCTNYPTQALKQRYCRNFPAPAGAPAVDQNPQDYKVVHVTAYSRTNVKLAEVDTQVAARVAETASNTGSLFVNIIDATGAPVQGAKVQVTNTALNPDVIVSDTSDSQGIAIFYGLPPDTSGFDYSVSASSNGYSSLATLVPAGGLQPNYPSQNVFAQQTSYVTLSISPQATDSIAIEAVTTSGAPLANLRVHAKGGYKRYNAPTDTSYYYDNLTPTDSRPTTDAGGLTSLQNLAPGSYYFCGDNGSSGCVVGGTTYYLAAAVPYGGTSILSPIAVPLNAPNPPAVFPYNSANYLQKVRLILSTNQFGPRVVSITPSEASQGSGTLAAFNFQVTGANLPCSSNPASCNTSVTVTQGAQSFPASCTGTGGTQLDCTVNISSAAQGRTSFVITANGNTLTLPDAPLLGGINVTP